MCRRGCDACCRTRRTAWAVEVEAIRSYVSDLPAARQAALRVRRERADVVAGERCVFLDDDGGCAVYAARPVLCRTHGPAVKLEGALAWCALNFEGADAAELLDDDQVLDADRLNLMLLLVNQRFLADNPRPEREALEAAI